MDDDTSKPAARRLTRNRSVGRAARLRAMARAGNRCSFPGCLLVQDDQGLPLLEVAHIDSAGTSGFDYTSEQLASDTNLIVLCPTHHRIVDMGSEYSAAWRRSAKERHEQLVRDRVELAATPMPREVSTTVRSPLVLALEAWNTRHGNESEEHWQQLFMKVPACFAMMLQGRAFRLGGKSYVGGKRVDNRGGNELDFLVVHATSLACIEIKTASASLLGKKYRGNVHLPSEDLVGACVQVLESRRSLMQSLDMLNSRAEPADRLVSDNHPKCFVVVGDLSKQNFTVAERASFDLFRNSLRDVHVYTFDELFDGVAQLLDLTEATLT